MQYQPKLLVDKHHIALYELDMHEELAPALEEMVVDKLLDDMMMAEVALQLPVKLCTKACFAPGKVVHL